MIQYKFKATAEKIFPPQNEVDQFVFGASNLNLVVLEDLQSFLTTYGDNALHVQNSDGITALMSAAGNGNTCVVKFLLERGAAVHQKDIAGNTAMIYAARGLYISTAEILIAHGASWEDADAIGNTARSVLDQQTRLQPLLDAAADGDLDKVKELLDDGVPLDGKDKNDETALVKATQNGCAEVAQYLVDHGADVSFYIGILNSNEDSDCRFDTKEQIEGFYKIQKMLLNKVAQNSTCLQRAISVPKVLRPNTGR